MAKPGSPSSSNPRVKDLEQAFERFKGCIEALPEDRYLEPMNVWSPRDVVAHFIGWNRYTIDGCRDIFCGVGPFYLDDEPNDFCHVNAASVQRYASTSRRELLGELDTSFEELKTYLLSLMPSEWSKETEVKHEWVTITVENSVAGLRDDYGRHRKAIEAWSAA
jgi:hypothetical protein